MIKQETNELSPNTLFISKKKKEIYKKQKNDHVNKWDSSIYGGHHSWKSNQETK